MFENSTTFLAVANVANTLSDTTDSVDDLPTGAAGIFREIGDAFEKSATIRADAGFFYVGWKDAAGRLHKSPRFQGTKIINPVSKATNALTEQISYIGYNGTSGSIDVANSTYYSVRLVLNHTFGLLNNSPLMKTIPYKSTSAATQSAIAAGLVGAGVKTFARGVNKDVKIERINSGAVDNALATAKADLVHGGNTIVFDEDMTSLVIAGTILRLTGIGAGTSPCYIVTGHDSGAAAARIYTLDVAYQGPTITDMAANLIESVTEGDWGIKLTGSSIADADFNVVTDRPFVVDFNVELGEAFTSTVVTDSTISDVGYGTYQLVGAQEARIQFEDRPRHVQAYPPTVRRINAVVANTYEVTSFTAVDDGFIDRTTGGNPLSAMNFVIATESSLTTDFGDYVLVLTATDIS